MQIEIQSKKIIVSPDHLNQVSKNISRYNIQDFDIPDEMCNSYGVSPHGIDGTIDLNIFLSCFPKLRLKDGMILDYIYDLHPNHGDVLVYARKTTDSPILSTEQFLRHFPNFDIYDFSDFKWIHPFINAIEWEQSPEGYFDIALFLCYLRTIYLYDHGNYASKSFRYARSHITNWYRLNDIDTDIYYETSVPESNCCTVSFLSESMYDGTQREQITFVDKMPKFRKSKTVIEPQGPTILY